MDLIVKLNFQLWTPPNTQWSTNLYLCIYLFIYLYKLCLMMY